MFCPRCKCEYSKGITECTDCHIPLENELPPKLKVPQESHIKYTDLITFKTYPNQAEAELAKSFLVSHGIDAITSLPHFGNIPGVFKPSSISVRLLIREEDIKEVEAIFCKAGISREER